MSSNENEMERTNPQPNSNEGANPNQQQTNTEVKNEPSTQNNPQDSSSQQPNISIQNIESQSQEQNNPNNSQPPENQPQVNQPESSQPQPQPQPQAQQIQTQPQIPIQAPPQNENKIVFEFPMNNYCSIENIKEIEACEPDRKKSVITKRIRNIKTKIENILKKHERYTLFSLYYRLYNIFISNRQYGKDPKNLFKEKDPSYRMKVTDYQFSEVLDQLNCQLSQEEVDLILKSLKQKTNTLYSYDEFLSNVYNIQANERGQMRLIFQQCNFYFNDYLYSFRHFIQDNKIDYNTCYIRASSGMSALTLDIFKKFLNEMGFNIWQESEIEYLFSALCDANYYAEHIELKTNGYVSKDLLFKVITLNDINEGEFNKSGDVGQPAIKPNTEWLKNIKNFTEGSKEVYKKNYESFKKLFKSIHEKAIRYNYKDLITYFAESGKDISPDGEIDFESFHELMSNIDVSFNIELDTLISQFKNTKKKPKATVKLADFLSIYKLFNEEENNGIKFEEENLRGTRSAPNEQYIFANAHRKFTQKDIDLISEYCSGISDIITQEKKDTIENYFKQKDKRSEGFIYLNEFKDILKEDLEIAIEDEFQIFFDFITEDKMVQGSDIIIIDKLIHIITFYSSKEEGESSVSEEPSHNANERPNMSNNKVSFIEENPLKGTENQNLKEMERNEGPNTRIEDNNRISQRNTEIINTDINTSSISFDKIISDFAHCLYNNRIRFNDVFPSIQLGKIINNQTISEETLKLGFENAGFDLSEKEFSVVMTHFDPINKKTVSVESLMNEISKYEPKYFNQSYQNVDKGVIEPKYNEQNLALSNTFTKKKSNPLVVKGMNKIQSFLRRNKITPENFLMGEFSTKNQKTLDTQITPDFWVMTFIPKEKTISNIVPYLDEKEVKAIYKEMDPRRTNNVTLKEIIQFFNGYLRINDYPININEQISLNETIKNEIKLLFDNFDSNKSDIISFEDFYKCLKSVDHKATKNDANNILAEHSNNNKGVIDRNTFNEIMYNYIKKSLFIQKEEKDFIMNLFREADIDKNGYLTRNQVKYLMKNKINSNLSDIELDEILNRLDPEQMDEVDIRDFAYLLDNINSNPNNFATTANTINTNTISNEGDNGAIPIMNLNLNLNMHRKIRPKDFVSLYEGLPLSFIPSFIREEQQRNNLLPSSSLKPLTRDGFIYEDIFPVETLVYADQKEANRQNVTSGIIQSYKKLRLFTPKINCKICFDDHATGVSSPDETLFETPNSQFKVVGRLLKICLFNNKYKIFVGNAVSIDCIYKKEYQDRWYFETGDSKYNNNIIIRYNGNNIEDIDVVFEFVMVIQKKVDKMVYTTETSCGWSKIPLNSLQVSRKEKLGIMGGSPLRKGDINELDIRKKRIGCIPKIANLFEGQIKSECPIRVKTLKEFSNEEKRDIDFLPSMIVCHAAAMQMISIYRKKIGEYILNHKDYLLKLENDENDTTNMFCKIADVPDAFRIMNEIWKEIVIGGATSGEKNNEEYLKGHFELYVRKINSVLYAEKFEYNPLDPTELPRGDINLMQDRNILLNSALRSGQDKKFNKLDYKMDDYSYKPFTMDEINGQKGNNLLEKIDEMISLIN